MKNLIGLFFLIGSLSVYAQDTNKELVAENKPLMIKPKAVAPHETEIVKNHEVVEVATNVKTDIITGFKFGKTDKLAKYFPANIEINVLGKSNLYSKSQAKQVLTTFFTQKAPSSFAIVHEGNSNGTKYFIGTYISEEVEYRVTVNVKMVAGADQIASISIER